MHDIVKAKFTQNEEIKHKLLTTKAALFIKTTRDTYWGGGRHTEFQRNSRGKLGRHKYTG